MTSERANLIAVFVESLGAIPARLSASAADAAAHGVTSRASHAAIIVQGPATGPVGVVGADVAEKKSRHTCGFCGVDGVLGR